MYTVEVLAIFTMKIIKIHSENGRSVKVSFRKIWGIFDQHNRLSETVIKNSGWPSRLVFGALCGLEAWLGHLVFFNSAGNMCCDYGQYITPSKDVSN